MYYEVHGKGFPLVMIIGYTADSEDWDAFVPSACSQQKSLIDGNRQAVPYKANQDGADLTRFNEISDMV
jgi:hypothetical protein